MSRKKLLEDYDVEVKYSDNKKESDERLKCFANYVLNFGISEGIIQTPPNYNDSINITSEITNSLNHKINRDYAETPTANDLAYAVGASITGKVPVAGEIFNLIFTDPATKRRDDWIESLENRIITLENKYPNIIETIKTSQLVISATFYACSMALKTTNKEKLEAFQNIILNVALKPNYEEYKIQMFLSIIDSCTEWHIRLLQYFSDPKEAVLSHNPNFKLGSLRRILTMSPFWEIYPESKSNSSYLTVIMNDLHNKGLINVDGKYLLLSYDRNDTLLKFGYPYRTQTTDFGNELLSFIRNPE